MQQALGQFEPFYEETKTQVLRYIAAHCLDIADIEDLFQETYLSIYRSLSNRTERIENNESYAIAADKRTISKHYSAFRRFTAKVGSGFSKLGSKDLTEDIPDGSDIENIVADRELIAEISQIVAEAPGSVGRIFYMHYVLGMTLSEIAGDLGMPENTVKAQLYRTLAEIRRIYGRRDLL